MIKIILGIIGFVLMGIFGYILGILKAGKFIKGINADYRIPDRDFLPKNYDGFKADIEQSLEIGNIMDIAFNYGYTEGYEEMDKIENDKIDKMLYELSAETTNKVIFK